MIAVRAFVIFHQYTISTNFVLSVQNINRYIDDPF